MIEHKLNHLQFFTQKKCCNSLFIIADCISDSFLGYMVNTSMAIYKCLETYNPQFHSKIFVFIELQTALSVQASSIFWQHQEYVLYFYLFDKEKKRISFLLVFFKDFTYMTEREITGRESNRRGGGGGSRLPAE